MRRSSTIHRSSKTKVGNLAKKRGLTELDENRPKIARNSETLNDRLKALEKHYDESELVALMESVSKSDELTLATIESIALSRSENKRSLADSEHVWPSLRAKLLASTVCPSQNVSDMDLITPEVLIENKTLASAEFVAFALDHWKRPEDLLVLFGVCSLRKLYVDVWNCVERKIDDLPIETLIRFCLEYDPDFGVSLAKKSFKCGCENERQFAMSLLSSSGSGLRQIVLRRLGSQHLGGAPSWIKHLFLDESVELDKVVNVRLAAKLLDSRLMDFGLDLIDNTSYSSESSPALFEFIRNLLGEISSFHGTQSLSPFMINLVNRCRSRVHMDLVCYLFRKCPHLLKPHVVQVFGPRFQELSSVISPQDLAKFVGSLEHLMAHSSTMRNVVFETIKTSLFEPAQRVFLTSLLLCLLRHVKLLASSVIPSSQASQIVSISSQYASQSGGSAELCVSAIDVLRRSLRAGGLNDPATMRAFAEHLPRVRCSNPSLAEALYGLVADLLEINEIEQTSYGLLVKSAAWSVDGIYCDNQSDAYKRLCAILAKVEERAFADDSIFKLTAESLIDFALKQNRSIAAFVERINCCCVNSANKPQLSPQALEIAAKVLLTNHEQDVNEATNSFLRKSLLSSVISDSIRGEIISTAVEALSEPSHFRSHPFWLALLSHANAAVDSVPLELLKSLFDEPSSRRALLEFISNSTELEPTVSEWVNELFEASLKVSDDTDSRSLIVCAKLISDRYPFDSLLRYIRIGDGNNTEFVSGQLEKLVQTLRAFKESTGFTGANEQNLVEQIVSLANCLDEWVADSGESARAGDLRPATMKAKVILKFYQFISKFVTLPNLSSKLIDSTAKSTGSHLQTVISSFMISVQNLDNSRRPRAIKRTESKTISVVKQTALARIIPQIVQSMELYETTLVSLSKQRGVNFLHYFKLAPSRDFRIDKNQLV